MRKIRTIFELFIVVFLFFVLLVPPTLVVLPFKQSTRNKILNPFWKLFSQIILIFPIRTSILSVDLRRIKADQNALYIVNHQSFIDIPLLSAYVQIPPIMKHEVALIPILGFVCLISGAITVKRKDPASRKKALLEAQKRLKNGFAVQYYPEGTRSKNGRPKSYEEIFKSLIDFCYKEKITVVPISMYGTQEVLNSDGSFNHGKHLGIFLDKEVFPEEFDTQEDFSKYLWEKVVKNFDELERKIKLNS